MHYGDSGVIIKFKDGTVQKLENPNEIALNKLDDSVVERAVELAKVKNTTVLNAKNNDEIKIMLEENRDKKNQENGYWTLGTSVEAVAHAVLFEEDANNISDVLLHSDGFNYKILGLSLEEVMEKSKTQSGLESLQIAIREKEESDEDCNKYPRLKKHDDMAVVYNAVQLGK